MNPTNILSDSKVMKICDSVYCTRKSGKRSVSSDSYWFVLWLLHLQMSKIIPNRGCTCLLCMVTPDVWGLNSGVWVVHNCTGHANYNAWVLPRVIWARWTVRRTQSNQSNSYVYTLPKQHHTNTSHTITDLQLTHSSIFDLRWWLRVN